MFPNETLATDLGEQYNFFLINLQQSVNKINYIDNSI